MNFSKEQLEVIQAPITEKTIVMAAAASGKALENGSIVYTDNGPRKIEDLKVGDKIFSDEGVLCNILGVFPQGKKRKYKVTLSDDTYIYCCDEHLWTFQTEIQRSHKSKTWNTCTLKEIINNYPLFKEARAKNNFGTISAKRKNIFLPMVQPVQFSKKELPLDPYTLGALLGDGNLGSAGVQNRFSNEDLDVLERVEYGINKVGYTLVHLQNYDYRIKQQDTKYGEKGKLIKILEDLGLDGKRSENKFIPDIYKYSCVEDRLELLKGIIDTDGHCAGSYYDLMLKSEQLIDDIKEICESLGLTAVKSSKNAVCTNSSIGKKDCGIVYRLYIKPSKNIPKIHSSKKREQQWKATKVYAMRAIVNIEETDEEVEMTCIKVDSPRELFVTNNFIVTHNTATLTERVRFLLRNGVNPTGIVAITFTNNAAVEMRERLGDDFKEGMFMGTMHSYANMLLTANGHDTTMIRVDQEFDKLFDMLQTYPECLREIDYLLCDESQDLNPHEFEFITEMLEPKACLIVGDVRQCIYQFKDADPEMLMRLMTNENFVIRSLNENYRNGTSILELSNTLLDKMTDIPSGYSIPMKKNSGTVKFINSYQIINCLKKDPVWGKWAILCRANKTVEAIMAMLTKAGIPSITFRQAQGTLADLRDKMNQNAVKVLTIHSSKGLEFDNVIIRDYWTKNQEAIHLSYVAVTRARNNLFICKEGR